MPKICDDSAMHNLALNILDWFWDYIFFDRLSYLEAIRFFFQIFFLKILIRLKRENWKYIFRIFVFMIFGKKKILHCVCIACHKRMTISSFLLWLWHFSIIGGPEMPLRHAQFLLLLLIATPQWGQIRVCYLWSWITLGQLRGFSSFGHRGHWQVAHKPSFTRHLSVSPVPKTRKTVQLPQSNSTPQVTHSRSDQC